MAVALIAAGGLGGAVLYNSTGQRVAVLALAHDVPYGQVLTDADLVVARIATDPALKPLDAADRDKAVGMRAATDLKRGEMLTKAHLAQSLSVQPGQLIVGVSAKRTQLPATRLQPGVAIVVVYTPDTGRPESLPAVVITVGRVDTDGSQVIDVAVPSGDAAKLAAWVASQRIQVVLAPRGAATGAPSGRPRPRRRPVRPVPHRGRRPVRPPRRAVRRRPRRPGRVGPEMAVIAVAGGPGAPGATTAALALLLAWPLQPGRRILLVECDPDGGAVLAGALEGRVEAVYGLRNLAVADRRGLLAQTLWEQLIDLSPDGNAERLLLPGLTDPAQAPGLAYTWEPLMEVLHGLEPQGYDVILDLGRSGATGAGAVLARRADAVAVTVRTTLRGLSAARPRLSALAEDLAASGTGADAMGLLLVAEGPYSGAEVSREFGLPVIGLLPHAVRTARVLSDGGDTTDRRFIRSELMRTARSAADEVQLLVRRRRQRLAPTAAPAQLPAAPAPDPGADRSPTRRRSRHPCRRRRRRPGRCRSRPRR
ncbi:SAF domain-containing protein [Kitasatospora aburaviensis]